VTSALPVDAPAIGRRSVALDLLRIFAATWVAAFHWTRFYPLEDTPLEWLAGFLRGGYLGVDLFFMLSGAVIAHSAMGRTWHGFARARFLRLFPAFFAISLGVAAILFVIRYVGQGTELVPDTFVALTGLTFWSGGGVILAPAWTLELEVQFYVLVGLLVLICRNVLTPARLRMAAYVYFLVWLLAHAADDRLLTVLTIYDSGPLFVLGALLGISTTRRELQANTPAIIVALALTYYGLMGRTADMELAGNEQVVWILAIMASTVGIILWSSLRRSRPVRFPRLLAVIQTLSLMTYPIYLLHYDVGLPVIRRLGDLGLSLTLSTVGSVVLVLALSWFSVRIYEPWARRRLRRVFGWESEDSRPPRVVTTTE
jgi:exopolysaccharide production protein ExoZ